ncbi:MAG: efflux RND transporter periplasmic adaptor subunit [Phycisphaerae bacterium]
MHPEVQLPKPGKCPKCGMELIPLERDVSDDSSAHAVLTLSENAQALMEVQTAPVERRKVEALIRMTGKVDYDETRLSEISAWVPGRLDKLYVDYTGVPVQKGDHLVYLYSPELISAQKELLQAVAAAEKLPQDASNSMRKMLETTVQAGRERLRRWGLVPEQIAEVEKSGEVTDHITIYSPAGGIVIHKLAQEGMYVKEGTKIYTIADFSALWVKLDAYESDLAWLRYGQKVEFTTVSLPGEVFEGTVSFISPALDEKTRTVKVRLNVPNESGKLKPGMFVSATLRSAIALGGKIMDKHLAGKWICPMHPEIVSEKPGNCTKCSMPLVKTEQLGYASLDREKIGLPLVIPASAPLITGKRAVVYVRQLGADKPAYEGREIVLGARVGDSYIVNSGLDEGELVVVNGAFKIDSALQIIAKPSMMNPAQSSEAEARKDDMPAMDMGKDAGGKISSAFREQLAGVYESYFVMQQALASDDSATAAAAAGRSLTALDKVDMKLLSGDYHMAWMEPLPALKESLSKAAKETDIKKLREDFYNATNQLIEIVAAFGAPSDAPLYRLKCPMAFGGAGASWLQPVEQTSNPYFGAMMLRCGTVEQTTVKKDIWVEEN